MRVGVQQAFQQCAPLGLSPPRPPATCSSLPRLAQVPQATAASSTIRVAAALAAVQLLCHPLQATETRAEPAPQTAATEAATAPSVGATATSGEKTEAELREQTRKNTRVDRQASQKFTQAKRIASMGDFDAALAAYDELVAMEPTFAPAYSNRGNIYVALRRLPDAVADYTHALELAPLDGDAWVVYVNRAVARLALADDPRSILEDMNVAYERKGPEPLILANRAAVYEELGKYESAMRDYQRALKGNEVEPFWLRYALVLFERGRTSECVAILKRVEARFNVDDVKAALAVVSYEQGDLASAETQWSAMERPRKFESRSFLVERKWPPRAVESMARFRSLKE